MAGNSLSLAWNLIANDAASPVFEKVSVAADKAAASTEAAASKTGTAMSTLVKTSAVAGVAFAAVAVKMAADFQKQMLLVQTQAGASAQEVRNMTPAILSLSGKVAQAPEALATSLYHVESTGLRGKAALEAVKIAAEGAAVGHADLEETTNALTATIASGMVPATESFSQAMGQLNTIVGSGDMKLSDLNAALGTGFMVQVKQYGATLNDVGAALADFGDNNIRGADAATMVRMAVQAIAVPGVNAAAALGRVGLTVEQLQSDEQTGGLNKALIDLHTHLESSGIASTQWGALMTDAFTKKAGGGITTLIGTFDRFEQKYKEVREGSAGFASEFAATTHTAAFQAAALKDNIEAMTTSIGTHLLPVATNTMSWINSTGVPALEHLGSGAEGVAHWFGELPAPIRDTALALGGLALANTIGLTGTLTTGLGRVRTGFVTTIDAVKGLGDEMAVQQRLAQMEAASISEVDAALGGLAGSADAAGASLTRVQLMMRGWDVTLAETAVAEDATAAATGRLGASLSTVASRGVAGLAKGLGGLVSLVGGPVGVAIGGAILAYTAFNDSQERATDNTSKWVAELKKGGDAATQATKQMTEASARLDDAGGFTKWAAGIVGTNNSVLGSFEQLVPGLGMFSDKVREGGNAAEAAKKQYDDWLKSLSPGEKVQQDVTTAQQALNDAVTKYGPDSLRAKEAAQDYLTAQSKAKTVTDGVSKALANASTQMDKAGLSSQGFVKGLEYAASAAGMSKDQIDAANKSWDAWIKKLSGLDQAFADPLTIYEDLLSKKQQAEQKSAEATAASTKSGKDSWQDYAQNVSVSLSDYAKQLETQLKNEQDWQTNLVKIAQRGGVEVAQQFADMGIKGADLTAQMATATDGNFTRMATDMANEAAAGGSQAAQNLDTAMRVMAEIGSEGGKATAANVASALGVGADQVAAIAKQYGVDLASGINPILSGLGKPVIGIVAGGAGLIGRNAEGGYITGPGSGTSDSILSYLSNGEFVVRAAAASQHRDLLEAINSAPGFAAGGFVSPSDVPAPYSTAPFQWPISTPADAGMTAEHDAAVNWLKSLTTVTGATGLGGSIAKIAVQAIVQAMAAMRGWGSGPEWTALAAVINRESGWNPNAANPTSSARGLFQKMTSINGPLESTLQGQTNWGLNYIAGRYGDPLHAWAHEVSAGWYDQGGWLQPGLNIAMNGTGRPERVVGPGQGGPTYINHVTMTGADPHQQAAALMREQRLQEFLHA